MPTPRPFTISRNSRRSNNIHTLMFERNANLLKAIALFTLCEGMGGIPPKSETQAKPSSECSKAGGNE
jgi:hypothetical protein